MGTQFLAAATSLPELATSYAAIRINAPELAISNLLGSNIFNMGFVLFLDDVAYTNGAFWAAISPIHVLTGVFAVLMTLILVLYLRSGVGKVSLTFQRLSLPYWLVCTRQLVFSFGDLVEDASGWKTPIQLAVSYGVVGLKEHKERQIGSCISLGTAWCCSGYNRRRLPSTNKIRGRHCS